MAWALLRKEIKEVKKILLASSKIFDIIGIKFF